MNAAHLRAGCTMVTRRTPSQRHSTRSVHRQPKAPQAQKKSVSVPNEGKLAAQAPLDRFEQTALKQKPLEEGDFAALTQKLVASVVSSPGYGGLGESEQQKLRTLISGDNRNISLPARYAASRLVDSDVFRQASSEGQTEMLRAFLKDESYLPPLVASFAQSVPPTVPYTLSEPVVSTIPSGSSTIQLSKYKLLIDGREILVQAESLQKPGWMMHSVEEAVKGLAALPKSNRDLVQRLYLSGAPNSMDEVWAKQFNRPDFHTYMTAGAGGMVNVFPATYLQNAATLAASMLHETGHVLSQRKWGTGGTERWNAWIQAAASDGLHASQYAKESPEEDFSETLALYMSVKGSPAEAEIRALMSQRMLILDEFLKEPV